MIFDTLIGPILTVSRFWIVGSMGILTRQVCAPSKCFFSNNVSLQANPLACAASLAVQMAIASENLLANVREQGGYLGKSLRERLQSPNALAKPYVFDIRGGGGFWGVEFDFSSPESTKLDFKGGQFSMLLQAKCLENGLVIMGFTGGSNLEGTKGNHCIIAPAYNATREEIQKILDIFVDSIESILKTHFV